MAKKIVFTVIDNGIDGKEKDTIKFASFDELERDNWYQNAKNKNWFRLSEKIIDVDVELNNLFNKLSAIDMLILKEMSKVLGCEGGWFWSEASN